MKKVLQIVALICAVSLPVGAAFFYYKVDFTLPFQIAQDDEYSEIKNRLEIINAREAEILKEAPPPKKRESKVDDNEPLVRKFLYQTILGEKPVAEKPEPKKQPQEVKPAVEAEVKPKKKAKRKKINVEETPLKESESVPGIERF